MCAPPPLRFQNTVFACQPRPLGIAIGLRALSGVQGEVSPTPPSLRVIFYCAHYNSSERPVQFLYCLSLVSISLTSYCVRNSACNIFETGGYQSHALHTSHIPANSTAVWADDLRAWDRLLYGPLMRPKIYAPRTHRLSGFFVAPYTASYRGGLLLSRGGCH